MHIPDGFLNVGTSIATGAASVGAVGYGLRQARKQLDEKRIPLLALTAAFIFAAQMINFPVAGGTSGHFLGAILAVTLLGPWMGSLVISLVLLVQAFGFADGGITALGANIFNMAVVGAIGGYLILAGLEALLPKSRWGFMASLAAASWLSVTLAAAAASLELAISGTVPFRIVFTAMSGVHALIGIGEALITCVVVSVILAARPDLVRLFRVKRLPELEKAEAA